MRVSGFRRRFMGAAVAAVLAGCGGTQVGVSAPGAALQTVGPQGLTSARHAREWLYTSGIGAGGTVAFAYTFPGGRLVRQFGVFFGPIPMCVDAAGDLFVLSFGIVEYEPGGGHVIGTLKDRSFPSSCAIDTQSGDLAVTNFNGRHGRGASIAIFAGARGVPKYYFDPAIAHFVSAAYDANGNLFADGFTAQQTAAFAELPRGSRNFTAVSIRPAIERPGKVHWDGTDFAVGLGRSALIRRVKVSGAQGHVVGTTRLGKCAFTDYVILGDSVAAACGAVVIFDYPAGGSPTKVLRDLHPGDISIAVGS